MLKSGSRFWLAMLAVILLGSFGACSEKPTVRPGEGTEGDTLDVVLVGDPAVIGVIPGVAPTLEPDRVPVNRGDHIRWANPFGVTVTVHLQRAPVTPTVVEIPPDGVGMVTVLTEAPFGVYKYDITLDVEGERIVVDPHIDVRPKG